MTRQQNGKKFLLLSVIWTATSLIALFAPNEIVGAERTLWIPGLDKVGHCGLFTIWTYLVAKAFSERKKSINLWTFSGGFALIAGLTEVIQHYIGRSFEWLDVLADVLGIILGLLIYKRV